MVTATGDQIYWVLSTQREAREAPAGVLPLSAWPRVLCGGGESTNTE
jgi:hypothetical protein